MYQSEVSFSVCGYIPITKYIVLSIIRMAMVLSIRQYISKIQVSLSVTDLTIHILSKNELITWLVKVLK